MPSAPKMPLIELKCCRTIENTLEDKRSLVENHLDQLKKEKTDLQNKLDDMHQEIAMNETTVAELMEAQKQLNTHAVHAHDVVILVDLVDHMLG